MPETKVNTGSVTLLQVNSILSGLLPKHRQQMDLQPTLLLREDLNLDSLKLVELFLLVEKEFNIDLFGDTANIYSINDLVQKIVAKQLSAKDEVG